jgi:5S rRNA maturation endonuclease (ribonuclease M5)
MSYASLEEALIFGTEVERPYVCAAHADHNASASVNSETGWFFCFVCGHAGKVDLDRFEVSIEGMHRFTLRMARNLEERPDRFPEAWLNAFDSVSAGGYWLSRFTPRTCRFFRLGSARGVATYPMRDNVGKVLGVVTRDLTGEREEKYKYPWTVKKSKYLIDYHRVVSDTIVLVEGMADVAAVYEAGYHMALGCYGSQVSNAQLKLVRKYLPSRVLVGFDMDYSGDKGFHRVADALRGEIPVQRLWWDTYNDIAEIPLSDRRDMLQEVVGHDSVTRVDQGYLAS